MNSHKILLQLTTWLYSIQLYGSRLLPWSLHPVGILLLETLLIYLMLNCMVYFALKLASWLPVLTTLFGYVS
jgi:hypothetical protein